MNDRSKRFAFGNGFVAHDAIKYFVIIDLLFLPYFHGLVVPISLPVVIATLLLGHLPSVRKSELVLFLLLCFWVFLGAWIGQVFYPSSADSRDDILRAGQLVSSFAYYFYFKSKTRERPFDPTRVFVCFVVFQLVAIVYFYLHPVEFAEVRASLFPHTADKVVNIFKHFRYTYFFTDPNTAAYFALVCAFFVWTIGSSNHIVKWCMLPVSVLLVIATNSRGAVVSLAVMLVVVILRSVVERQGLIMYAVWKGVLTIAVIGLCLLVFSATDAGKEVFTLGGEMYGRYEARAGGLETYGTSRETRVKIWSYMVSSFEPWFFGRGYSVVRYPHSDHLRMIYSYGLVAYVVLLWFTFRFATKRGFEFLIPAFTAFSINSLIDEQKFLALVLSLVAITQGMGWSNSQKRSEYLRLRRRVQ